MWKNSDYDFKFKNIEVNEYVLDFQTDYDCENGLYMRNGLDMTNFFQLRSLVTKTRWLILMNLD